MHVKKQELPMHEPRGAKTLILACSCRPPAPTIWKIPTMGTLPPPSPAMERVAPLELHEPVEAFDLPPQGAPVC